MFLNNKFLLVVLLSAAVTFSANAQTRQVIGWVEKVRLFPADIVIHAKMDSGADYSSLSAQNINRFERNGADWVKFTIKNRYGHKAVIEKKIVRVARIKSHNLASRERFVIRLGLCLGNTYMEEEVNLADRSNFDYQMLIGRSFLSGNVLIDPSLQYSFEPNCSDEDEEAISEPIARESTEHISEKLPYEFKSAAPKLDLTKEDLDQKKTDVTSEKDEKPLVKTKKTDTKTDSKNLKNSK